MLGKHFWQFMQIIICACENKHSAFCFEHFFFLFYDFNLNTQGFVYLEFAKYQLGLHRNMQCMHIYYTVVFFKENKTQHFV